MISTDSIVLEQLQAGLKLLMQGKYPGEITAEITNPDLAAVVTAFNHLATQLKELHEYTLKMSRGILTAKTPSKTNFLAGSLKDLHCKLNHLTWQTQQIEQGDYKQRIDFMGEFSTAFNSMVVTLEERELRLKEEIAVRKQAEAEVRTQNQLITDSLHYAAAIQRTILPNPALIESSIADYFIIWQPRSIVGGDFYWFYPFPGGMLAAVIDCTGHGVPGALMTLAVSQILRRMSAMVAAVQPADLLVMLDEKVRETFYSITENRDLLHVGLDMAILKINTSLQQAVFSGARLSLFHYHDNYLEEIPGSRRSIGYQLKTNLNAKRSPVQFENKYISYLAGDRFYLATDGLFDQYSTHLNEPFGIDRFTETIIQTQPLPMREQKNVLLNKLTTFIANDDQRDDITVIGFQI